LHVRLDRCSGWCSTNQRSTPRLRSSASARSSSKPSTSEATRSLAESGKTTTLRLRSIPLLYLYCAAFVKSDLIHPRNEFLSFWC
jgi:hypothetical protein